MNKGKYYKLMEVKCSQEGCFNYSAEGYSLCESCIHGSPMRMDEKDIEFLKDYNFELEEREVCKKCKQTRKDHNNWSSARNPKCCNNFALSMRGEEK